MVMRARVILRIKQVQHCDEDVVADEGGDGDDDEDADDEDDDEDADDDDDDDHDIAGVGQAVVYWCGDCGQVIKQNISKLNIHICIYIC